MSKRAVLAKVKEVRPDGSAVLEPLVDLSTWNQWYRAHPWINDVRPESGGLPKSGGLRVPQEEDKP